MCRYVLAKMGQHEASAVATRAAVNTLHSVASLDTAAAAPGVVQTHLTMLAAAYSNLAVSLSNMALDADLPTVRLLSQRAAATLALVDSPAGKFVTRLNENVTILAKKRSTSGMALAKATPATITSKLVGTAWKPSATRG